jgi:hypothetical protein
MNSMQSSSTISVAPPAQGIAFKFFVVISLLVLFGLFLYAILGPLPNQSKFLTKTGTSDSLDVNGNAIITGNTTIGGKVEISGNLELENPLYGPEFNLITISGTTGTSRGKFKTNTNGEIIIDSNGDIVTRPTGSLFVKDYSETTNNITVAFNPNTKRTDFYGNVILNNESGNNSLVLKNQNTNPEYRIKNDTATDNLIIESSNNILNATSNGNTVNLMKDSTAPFLYVGTGLGRVYDTVYNIPPSLTPVVNSLTVNGLTDLNGTTTTKNLIVDSGSYLESKYMENLFGSTQFFNSNEPLNPMGRITIGSQNMYVQGENSVKIGHFNTSDELASFDTSQPWNTASNISSIFNLRGFMKYTLPAYNAPGATGLQQNKYVYITTYATNVTATNEGWPGTDPVTSYIGGWSGTNNALIIPSPQGYYWKCPIRGIWAVTFNSYLNLALSGLSLAIGNVGNGSSKNEPYGIDKVSTTVVIDKDDQILVAAQSGTGNISSLTNPVTMTFSLIMELNDAKDT